MNPCIRCTVKNITSKILSIILLSVILALSIFPERAFADPRLQVTGDHVVIVIDPGHGGSNEGANAYGPIEKNMTLITAQAMYAELSKYDNCTVYMTRNSDVDMSLSDRAQYAQNVGASFLFSIHYNASNDHKKYGSEVLIQKSTPFNNYGYQFAQLFLSAMGANGSLIRGAKTKNGSDGGDYYGLLRESANRAIPAVIIEHCYLDYSSDLEKCNTIEKQQALGVLDATCVAQYFGLYSTSTGVDYRGFAATSLQSVPLGSSVVATLDEQTAPDACTVTQVHADKETGEVKLSVHGEDKDDALIYYDYSLDKGLTYSEYIPWPGNNALYNSYDEDFEFTVKLDPKKETYVVVRAHNMFDGDLASEPLKIDWENGEGKPEDTEDDRDEYVATEEPLVPETGSTSGSMSNVWGSSYLPQASTQDTHEYSTEEAVAPTETATDNTVGNSHKLKKKQKMAFYIAAFSIFTGAVITGGLIYIFMLMGKKNNRNSKTGAKVKHGKRRS